MIVDLDGITAQYLIDSGVSEAMKLSWYQPGGQNFTDAEAMRWAITHKLGVETANDRDSVFNETQIMIRTGWSSISAETMRALLDTQIRYEGRTYEFESITCDAETYSDYGSEGLARWMEITFKVQS